MLRDAKNTVQGAKMAFGTPFLATPFGVALTISNYLLLNNNNNKNKIWGRRNKNGTSNRERM